MVLKVKPRGFLDYLGATMNYIPLLSPCNSQSQVKRYRCTSKVEEKRGTFNKGKLEIDRLQKSKEKLFFNSQSLPVQFGNWQLEEKIL